MKNLKIIITILVLSLIAFGCETSEDFYEFPENQEVNSEYNLKTISSLYTVKIKVDYRDESFLDIFQGSLRDYYVGFFDFRGYTVCRELNGVSLQETWEIEEISEEEFYNILNEITPPVFTPPTTITSVKPSEGGGPTDIPPPGISYQLTFEYGESCN